MDVSPGKDAKWTDGTDHGTNFVYRERASRTICRNYASFMYIIKNGMPYNDASAFVRDPQTGKFATEDDLKNAGTDGAVTYTGGEPPRFDQAPSPETVQDSAQSSSPPAPAPAESSQTKPASVKYLFVPSDAADRDKLLKGTCKGSPPNRIGALRRGKKFVPVPKDHVACAR